MPRIPEGQFRLDPSVRVGNESVPEIRPTGASELKQLGGQFVKMADQLEKAELRANAMQEVRQVELEFNTFSTALTEEINKNSVGGTMQDPDNPEKRIPTAEYTQRKIASWRGSKEATMSASPEVQEAYQSYIVPDLQKIQSSSKTLQTNQIVNAADNHIDESEKILQQKILDGSITQNDVLRHSELIDKYLPVIGAEARQEKQLSWRNTMAGSVKDGIMLNGTEKEGLYRSFTMMMPESAGRLMKREIEDGRKSRAEADKLKGDNDHKFLINGLDISDPQTLHQQAGIYAENYKRYGTAPMAENETIRERASKLSDFVSKDVAGSSVFELKDGALLIHTDRELLAKRKEDILKQRENDLKKLPLFRNNKALLKNVMDQARGKIETEFDNFVFQSRVANPYGTKKNMNPSYETAFMSKDPELIDTTATALDRDYQRDGVAVENRDLADPKDAKVVADMIQENTKGQGDINGEKNNNIVQDIRDDWGRNSLIRMSSLIKHSQGTKGRDPAISEEFMVATYIEDPDARKEVMATYGKDADKLMTAAAETLVAQGAKSERAVKRSIESAAMKYSRSSMLKGTGQGTDNTFTAQGMLNTYKGLIAARMEATGESADEAGRKVFSKLSQHVTTVTDGQDAVVLNGEFLKKNTVSPRVGAAMMRDMKDLKHLDKMTDVTSSKGIRISMPLLAAQLKPIHAQAIMRLEVKDSSQITPQDLSSSNYRKFKQDLDKLKPDELMTKKGASEETREAIYKRQLRHIQQRFGDSIRVLNDSRSFNSAKLYIRVDNKNVPIPVVKDDGSVDNLTIDVEKYYGISAAEIRKRHELLDREQDELSKVLEQNIPRPNISTGLGE